MSYTEDNEFVFKLVLPAGMIPEGETVTKKTGEKPYVLRTRLQIYSTKEVPGVEQVIQADGAKFMVDERGNINVIGNDKELMWHVPEDRLLRFLHERNEPTPQ